MAAGDAVEVFDPAGRSAKAVLHEVDRGWSARLTEATRTPRRSPLDGITIFSAVPKGNRADWMVEKLAELGVARFVPIVTSRSVVEPGGNKLDRWRRIAVEAAKQSRAAATLAVGEVTPLANALELHGNDAVVLSTERPGTSLLETTAAGVFIGPEGGWTDLELKAFEAADAQFASLGGSVLRVETAAVCAAAVVAHALARDHQAG